MSSKLYVGNLSFATTDDELLSVFAPFGDVISAKVMSDRMTGRSRGFGFVEMENETQAQAAIDALNQTDVGGRNIIVSEARPQPAQGEGRPPRRFEGGGGMDFSGGGPRGGAGQDRNRRGGQRSRRDRF